MTVSSASFFLPSGFINDQSGRKEDAMFDVYLPIRLIKKEYPYRTFSGRRGEVESSTPK